MTVPTAAPEASELTARLEPADGGWLVHLGRAGRAYDLSDLLPSVEAFGFHVIDADAEESVGGVHQRLRVRSGRRATAADAARLTDALRAALSGQTQTDPLLELVATTPLTWQQVDWLRGYRQMLGFLGSQWSEVSINAALRGNPDASWALANLFVARLSPDRDDEQEAVCAHTLAIVRNGVESLTDDRIIADLGSAVNATTRTNAFARDRSVELGDGRRIDVLALKFSSDKLPAVPAPVPYAEILVTSALTSGVHLRGGPIARGGLRASDRTADVRSEVLGLLQAQIVKNAMIVPTGAKGGFVLHSPPGDRQERLKAVDAAYRVFVTGLLSLTDNIVAGEVVHPEGISVRDGDDPYLVVAADKGTAHLSDTANRLADDAGFWLGDAFASGGSAGYDHKALGITAKGAWVAIARHFRELDLDILTDEITVAGIGDMSGDVFGNGLLTTPTLQLVAAFDHRDIFLDPDPDPATSFRERQRLFDLPGSSWQDYDRDVLSPGGGIFSRSAKHIELDERLRDLLRISDKSLAPDALIRAILRIQVDLFYAGGIGTYVKASTQDEVGDRANAAIRVDADEVNARVFGEGANLAITQQGRIEYARRGGRIDQDAVHNAAGVAISDREVNLKILFAPLVIAGDLDRNARDDLLTAATGEVVEAVCADVDAQVWLLSREHARSAEHLSSHARLLEWLEAAGLVDRQIDVLPDDSDLAARAEAGGGLTRPELATIVAATKRHLTAEVVDSDLPEQRGSDPALLRYFPTVVKDDFTAAIRSHRLAREITSTRIVSGLIDRFGPTVVNELATDFDLHPTAIVAALWVAQQLLDGNDWWTRLQAAATEVPPATLEGVAADLSGLQLDLAIGLLRDEVVTASNVDDVLAHQGPIAEQLRSLLADRAISGRRGRRRMDLLEDLVPDDLAVTAATVDLMRRLPDVAALHTGRDAGPDVSAILKALRIADYRLRLADLDTTIAATFSSDRWSRRHAESLHRDLIRLRRETANLVLTRGDDIIGTTTSTVVAARSLVDAATKAAGDGTATPSDALGAAVAALRGVIASL